jgi:hypothetical protein
MIPKEKMRLDLKWSTRQRLQYIEVMAWYTGVVSRSDVARAFGLSDPAATKDLKLYSDLAPGNLVYNHSVFGFVPGEHFSAVFADIRPAAVLPVIAANLAVANGPYGAEPIYGLATASLPLPARLPSPQTLAQITRAIHGRRKLQVSYRSLSRDGDEGPSERIIEPHTLVDTGLRWHVRAYNAQSCDFRDFVLSRIHRGAMPGRAGRIQRAVRRRLGGDGEPQACAAQRAGRGQAREPAAGLWRERRRHRGERAARPARLRAAATERRHHAGPCAEPERLPADAAEPRRDRAVRGVGVPGEG